MSKTEPSYYKQGGKDLFDRFEDGLMTPDEIRGFYKGNIIKYLTRYREKNGAEDLQKADTYLSELFVYEKTLDTAALKAKNADHVKRGYLVYLRDFDDCEFGTVYPTYEEASKAIDQMVEPNSGQYYVGQVMLADDVLQQ